MDDLGEKILPNSALDDPESPPVVYPQYAVEQPVVYLDHSLGIIDGEYVPPEYAANQKFSGIVPSINRLLSETRQQKVDWNVTAVNLWSCIHTLSTEITELRAEIQQLCKTKTFVVPLTTLAPRALRMLQPIPVTIEGDGEQFTATFTEANVSASGETEADAIANFKDSLLSSYEVLSSMPVGKLGPLPSRQWAVLQTVVDPVE
jgi:hypothetical protein